MTNGIYDKIAELEHIQEKITKGEIKGLTELEAVHLNEDIDDLIEMMTAGW